MSAAAASDDFERLLAHIKQSRGFDFTGYKRPSLGRRIATRLHALGIESYELYQRRLEADPDEFARLFDAILINVTSFFRDPQTWAHVNEHVLPQIIDASDGGPVRVWSTGCATGEEAYTIAMQLVELMGEKAFRQRAKIYATDVDEDALAIGRHAVYDAKAVAAVPAPMLEAYFEENDRGYAFRKDLRGNIIFGRNDLIQDPPISRIDLLSARNTLMYFVPEMQSRILANFAFALNESGFLLLGKSEVLMSRSRLFMPVDLKRRVFRKTPRRDGHERLGTLARESVAAGRNPIDAGDARIREAALESSPSAQLVVAGDGTLAFANHNARVLFALTPQDIARPLQDLEVSYRPLELRSLIDQVSTQRRTMTVQDVEWRRAGGDVHSFDVSVSPLTASDGNRVGTSIVFVDVTRYRRLHEANERAKHELETAYEELQATAEELETTNEELQSTNEELETTNEELQSTNEELETMNEELQSTNEELETINDELRERTDELDEANAFLGSVLTSFGKGVVVLDQQLRVQEWNDHAVELWGLRAEEVVDEHFLNLDIGLPVAQLRAPIRACLSGEAPSARVVLRATNRRGRALECAVSIYPLIGAANDVRGAILLMEDLGAPDG